MTAEATEQVAEIKSMPASGELTGVRLLTFREPVKSGAPIADLEFHVYQSFG
jgi:hypothetical protein